MCLNQSPCRLRSCVAIGQLVRRKLPITRYSDISVPERAQSHSRIVKYAGRTQAMSVQASPGEYSSAEAGPLKEEVIVQYVVLRRDLYTELKWPLGSIVAQACHASTAALWDSRNEQCTQDYCSSEHIDSMHKVVLEVKGEVQLQNLAAKLKNADILYRLWIEQPENFPTCLATAPYGKSTVQKHFKNLKLCNF